MPEPRLTLGVALAATAVGAAFAASCSLLPPELLMQGSGTLSSASDDTAVLLKQAGITLEQTEVVPAGILAKNSSKFEGDVASPQGILAKNSSKYRVASLNEEPVPDSPVVLSNPNDRIFIVNGEAAITKTDSTGHFDFGDLSLPAGRDMIVRAYAGVPLEGYLRSAPGRNRIRISASSTFATNYLTAQARHAGKAFESFNSGKMQAILEGTDALLADGSLLATRELLGGGQAGINSAYDAAMREHRPDLLSTWRDFFGFEPGVVGTPIPVPDVMSTPGEIIRIPAPPG